MPDVFISYSRRDARDFVTRLARALEERGKDPWVDLDDIPPASRWEEDLREGVAGSDAFCFVISPGSVMSRHCQDELAYAVERNKRIVPVNHLEVPESEVPAAIVQHNWIPQDGVFATDFDSSLGTLVEAIETDLDWVRAHTRWGLRAEEWERRQRDRSLLARGSDLVAAEEFLSRAADRTPAPTALQSEFVIASRRAATHRQRQLVSSVSVALVVAVSLAVFALVQRQTALEQRRTAEEQRRAAVAERQAATSRALAANAFLNLASDPELSLLLGLEAATASPTRQAEDALRSALLASRVRGVLRHDAAVRDVAVSPDGLMIAAVSDDDSGALWRSSDGGLIATLRGHGQPPSQIRWSADGSRVVTVAQDSTARVWDGRTGRQVGVLQDPSDYRLGDVEISADGTTVITAGFVHNRVKVWDVASRTVVRVIPRTTIDAMAMSPDERLLLTAQQGERVELWRLSDGALLGAFTDRQRPFSFAGFSPDGRLFATAGDHKRVPVRDLDGRLVAEVRHAAGVNAAAFSPDSRMLATASDDGTVKVTDLVQGRLLATFTGHIGPVLSVAFSPDGSLVASGGADDRALLWQPRSGAEEGALLGHLAPVDDVEFEPDGSRVVTSSSDGTVRIWTSSPTGGAFERANSFPAGEGTSAFSVDGGHLVTANPRVEVINTVTGEKRTGFRVRNNQNLTRGLSTDGNLVVLSDGLFEHENARVRRVSNGDTISRLGSEATLAIGFDTAGERVVVGGRDGDVGIYDVASGSLVLALPGHEPASDVLSARFSADGDLVVTSGSDATVRLWDAADGDQLLRLEAFDFPPLMQILTTDAILSPDGTLLVSGANYDSDARLWNIRTGDLIATLEAPNSVLTGMAFDPSGRFLVTSYLDGEVLLWEVSSGRELASVLDLDRYASDVAFTPDGQEIAVLLGHSLSPPVEAKSTLDVLACDVCGGLPSLVELAHRRVTRELTSTERERYLDSN